MRITERLAWLEATCFGLGRIPWAPGTWGSGVGLLLYGATVGWPLEGKVCFLLFLTLSGVWASQVVATRLERKDPSLVIIDEVAGAYLALLGHRADPGLLVAGFILFRLFDIGKPWPVRRLERLSGGWGIMADDLAAGIITNLLLFLTVHLLQEL